MPLTIESLIAVIMPLKFPADLDSVMEYSFLQ